MLFFYRSHSLFCPLFIDTQMIRLYNFVLNDLFIKIVFYIVNWAKNIKGPKKENIFKDRMKNVQKSFLICYFNGKIILKIRWINKNLFQHLKAFWVIDIWNQFQFPSLDVSWLVSKADVFKHRICLNSVKSIRTVTINCSINCFEHIFV